MSVKCTSCYVCNLLSHDELLLNLFIKWLNFNPWANDSSLLCRIANFISSIVSHTLLHFCMFSLYILDRSPDLSRAHTCAFHMYTLDILTPLKYECV